MISLMMIQIFCRFLLSLNSNWTIFYPFYHFLSLQHPIFCCPTSLNPTSLNPIFYLFYPISSSPISLNCSIFYILYYPIYYPFYPISLNCSIFLFPLLSHLLSHFPLFQSFFPLFHESFLSSPFFAASHFLPLSDDLESDFFD